MRVPSLIILLLFGSLFWHYNRWAYPSRDETPAVVRSGPGLVTFVLSEKDGSRVCQIGDGGRLGSVNNLANCGVTNQFEKNIIEGRTPRDGEVINMEGDGGGVAGRWMPATHRILLGIPLHPDRMSLVDWEALPGVGPKLATAIETDRQKNGDFREFSSLDRVKGVGPKKILAWKEYFSIK